MSNKRLWLGLILIIAAVCILHDGNRRIRAGKRLLNATDPHVILIGIDTLRADFLSVYGFPQPISPAIDQIAGEGVVFTEAVATSPWTLPSFASILSGLYPSEHGAGTRTGAQRTGGEPPKLPLHREVPLLQEILVEEADFATGLFYDNPYLSKPWGLTRGFEFVSRSEEGGSLSVQRALRWMGDHKDRKMFVFLHLMEPHLPYKPPEPFKTQARVWIESQPLPRAAGAQMQRQISLRALYAGEVAYTDHLVGLFVDGLKQLGLYEKAIIIVTSDHGEEFLEHSETERLFYNDPRQKWGIGHGHSQYQELISVPLIIRFPQKQLKGRRVDSIVQVHDLAPSILEWVGVDAPEEMTGLKLSGALKGHPIRKFAFSEFILYGDDRRSYREGHWKLILGPDANFSELYDLSEDPNETVNLRETEPEILQNLVKGLRAVESAAIARGPNADREQVEIDEATLEELRALGYVG